MLRTHAARASKSAAAGAAMLSALFTARRAAARCGYGVYYDYRYALLQMLRY